MNSTFSVNLQLINYELIYTKLAGTLRVAAGVRIVIAIIYSCQLNCKKTIKP